MKIRTFLFVATSLLALSGFCDDAEVVKVRGKGIGTDRIEALKDAYRDAVEQAVGLYVDAEQMVENEDLVKDQILTQSNAYIEKYKIAKEGKSENGLIAVTILADVRKRALTRKIRDTMLSNKIDLSGISKNLHAQIVTDFKATDDALSIIRNELKGLQPLKQLMRLSLESNKPVVESVKEDASLVRLWYPIKVEVDANKYYKELAPRWERLLGQIKTEPANKWILRNNAECFKQYNSKIVSMFGTKRKNRTGIMTRCENPRKPKQCWDWCSDSSDSLFAWGLSLNEEYLGVSFFDTRIFGKDYVLSGISSNRCYNKGNERIFMRMFISGLNYTKPWLISSFDGDSEFCIGLITEVRGQILYGNIYKIPMDCVNEIVGWQYDRVCGMRSGDEFRESAPSVNFELRFLGRDDSEIIGQTFSLRYLEIMNFACVMLEDMERKEGSYEKGQEYAGGRQLWMITPLVGGFAKAYVKWISIDIPKDDVAKIATASISVEE